MEENKVFFMPGDIVTLKQDIPNAPTMLVIRKETSMLKKEGDDHKGIRCRWFTKEGNIQEAVFNTKDIIKIS